MALRPLSEDDEDNAPLMPRAAEVPPPPVPVAPRPPRKRALEAPPDAVVRRNKIRDTYKRLAGMKTSDIDLLLNEQLSSIFNHFWSN